MFMRTILIALTLALLPMLSGARAADVPATQADFMNVMIEYADLYSSATNELRKSALVTARRDAYRAAVPNAEANQWIGQIKAMGTTRDGQAWVEITLDSTTSVKTWNNGLSDASDRTLIPQSSPVYGSLAELSRGDWVVFDAQLRREASLTEAGGMTKPEFLARFRAITKLE